MSRAWHKFFAFMPDNECDDTSSSTETTGSVVTLVCFDLFIATAFSCSWDDSTDTVGGHRQKLYHDTFVLFLPFDYFQWIGRIRSFIKTLCPTDPKLSALSVFRSVSSTSEIAHWEAILELYFLSLKIRLLAVSWQWFCRFISDEIEAIHYCYIAECDSSKDELRYLGTLEASILSPPELSLGLSFCQGLAFLT